MSLTAPEIPIAKADSDIWQVGASSDDCLKFDGSFSIVHGNFYMDRTPGSPLNLENGVRFTSINIPKGSIIDSAYLTVWSTASNGAGGSLLIEGLLEADDDADTFSTLANFDGRARTTATITWNFQAMGINEWVSTPDIKTIIQEIVNRDNWASGNDLALGTDDNTNQAPNTFRVAPSWDTDNAHAPKLTITWTAIFPPSDPNLLFGAGFNSSSPYVELHWNHSLEDVQFFEVQNSSDGVSWVYLGQTTTANYTDSQVNNGTERYYRVRACNQTGGDWYNSSFTAINFETVYFIPGIAAEPGPTVIQNVTGEWVYYDLTTINVTIGIHDSGDLNSTLDIDGDTYNCSEVVGAPGYVIEFEWTDVDPDAHCLWVTTYIFYDGVSAHTISIDLWNFTSTAWVTIGTIYDMTGFEWVNSSIYDLRMPNDFINSTGAVRGRFYHSSAGNINDDIHTDFLKLYAFIPFEDGAIVTEQDFFWIFIAITLSMIVGIVVWLKYEHNNN